MDVSLTKGEMVEILASRLVEYKIERIVARYLEVEVKKIVEK